MQLLLGWLASLLDTVQGICAGLQPQCRYEFRQICRKDRVAEGSQLGVMWSVLHFTAHLCHAGIHGCSELRHLVQRLEEVSLHAGHLGALACTQVLMNLVRDQAQVGSTMTEDLQR